ncbi:Ycf66 protein N-terminal domain protein [Cyanobium sp. PCC 7001]|uniref:Ycf66 family protein n=1 Tax=Cyanobium sp. PCC 7001 TaxID=180281 RepID=UPI0001805313|nr:Ycf66 family protein [Cyanobium sp. PCC 7001]EDY38185.1 Ycf66 protein N-terminal domain protein [Cyanobium sp. PCC 7001]
MVNASLNWASIVGIVLAVGGALLYFMRSFKPALARDYDVFFAAVGLLCGGILFFQGWRLDPILQFGQFLLAGTTVFFAYESVRLRGVTTEQARRSSYFDDDEPAPVGPYRPRMGGRSWDDPERERFDEPEPLRRRIPSREPEEDLYRMRRASRAAIPERAASRRDETPGWDSGSAAPEPSRYTAGGGRGASDFGARRRERDNQPEPRRGSRPTAAAEAPPRSSRRPAAAGGRPGSAPGSATPERAGIPQGTPIRSTAAGGPRPSAPISDADFSPISSRPAPTPTGRPAAGPAQEAPRSRPRDNASRFDD